MPSSKHGQRKKSNKPHANYHEVFLPFPDVYELGGIEAFSQLERRTEGERNLVVVPMPFVARLDEAKTRENSQGAHDTLDALKGLDQRRTVREGMTICSMSEGLDVAFVDKPAIDPDDFSVTALEATVRKHWCREEQRPKLITRKEKYHIKFEGRGMIVEEPKFLQVSQDIVNEGIITGNDDLMARIYEKGNSVPLETAADMLGRELYINQFIQFRAEGAYVYARVTADMERDKTGSRIVRIRNPRAEMLEQGIRKMHVGEHYRDNVLGITPRDMEQFLAMQYGLLNPDVSLMFLCGSQGSGKTLLAYVCAIDQILWYDQEVRNKRRQNNEKKGGSFRNMIVLKPNEILGGKRRDIGALPGDLYQKIKPHIMPYIDAHRESVLGKMLPFEEMLLHPKFVNDFGGPRDPALASLKIDCCAHLPADMEMVEMTYSGFMRGRSFRDTLILMDEVQNWTPYEVKTIIERAGEGCKVVIMGDPAQTDNPNCSREINGLTHAIRHYLPMPYALLIRLPRNYRHQMSADADGWRVFAT
jgi:predicted ribonuclease YlaK